MSVLSEYDRTWAIRYLREAFAEYQNGKESQSEEQSRSSMAMAIRKAQLALQHAFGSPDYVELLVADATQGQVIGLDPTVRLLSTIALIAKSLSDPQTLWTRERILEVAKAILQTAATIIQDMTPGKNMDLQLD